MKFAEIILPIPLKGTFTYQVPEALAGHVEVGYRVLAQFGPKKVFTGVVQGIHENPPKGYIAKELLDVLDTRPIVHPIQFEFYEWLASYYMCEIGEVLDAAIPSGMKISSDSYISIDPDVILEQLDLTDREHKLLEMLRDGEKRIDEVADALQLKSIYSHVKSLSVKKAVNLFEKVKDRYTPKTEKRVRLSQEFTTDHYLDILMVDLEKRKAQQEAVLFYLNQTNLLESPKVNETGLPIRELVSAGISRSGIKTLVKNGVFIEWEQSVPRLKIDPDFEKVAPRLSPDQDAARNSILEQFEKHDTVLLKGITGSGKTEIYISLIQAVLENGGQVLYLLPEIALTTQIIQRLATYFGGSFGVYHSKFSENERVEVWNKVLNEELKFVVGVRSAVFLPFSDLSLIVIDEEHETSYKQNERSPRYHARDSAIYLATLFHAKTLLGSATPAIETYKNALDGKFGLVKLESRYGLAQLPEIQLVDITRERKQKKIRGNYTSALLDEIVKTLEQEDQVILFQNRRGYSPILKCQDCGFVVHCPNCDVSLTYHNYQNQLICHYCGHKSSLITECLQCLSHNLQTVGFGTEKLEEELEILLPEARIKRMDLDSTRSKYSYQQLIDEFESGEIQILIGTQMVTKGLDFDRVRLVGILDSDRMIHFPDFRAIERSFQLMHQVSGRAGRRELQGKVIIQTSNPAQPILQKVKHHDYEGFYLNEVWERERFKYPPYYRLIQVTLQDKDKTKVREATLFLYKLLLKDIGVARIIGPVEPAIARIRNHYLMEMTIKLEKQGINLPALKEFLLTSRNILTSQRLYKSVRVIFDVDPN